MARRRNPDPRFDAETIRACGELLRYVDESRSLRANAIVAKLSPGVDHRDIAKSVRVALDELSLRRREIVVRCDVKGEPYASVATSLHISERHLFRERRAALSRIAQSLLSAERGDNRPSVSVADPVDVRLAFTDALEHGGNWQAAAENLERLATDLEVPERRGAVEVRLARLYRNADRLGPAYKHADRARTLAKRVTVDGDLQRIEANVAVAAVDMCSGDWKLADQLAQQSIVELRRRTDSKFGTRIANALAQALLLRSEMLVDNDDVASAYALASEATSLAGGSAADPVLEINALEMAALTSLFLGKDVQRCEEVLWDCCRAALAHGLLRESLTVATHLSVYYRLSGRSADALGMLTPLLSTARVAGGGWVQAAVLCELVQASLDAGNVAASTVFAGELSTCSADNVFTRAWMDVSRARVHLARQEFVLAREAAQAAETVYAGIAPGRYLGTALRMEAEALHGMGETDLARRAIVQAVDSLKRVSNPRPLARAYRVMAKISGRQCYADMARKLVGESNASSLRSAGEGAQ